MFAPLSLSELNVFYCKSSDTSESRAICITLEITTKSSTTRNIMSLSTKIKIQFPVFGELHLEITSLQFFRVDDSDRENQEIY